MIARLFLSGVGFKRGFTEKLLFILLNAADLALTIYAMSLHLSELNPVMRSLLGSPLDLVMVKVVVPVAIAWLAPGKLLIPAVALLALVVGWDIKELVLFTI